MLRLALQKKKLLLEKFSSELQVIVSQEELLVQELVDLEPVRQELVKEITSDDNANLDAVIEKLSESEGKSDIWMIGSNLKETLAEIKKVNDSNQKLIEQALELTQYSIKLITQVPTDVTYGAGGQKREEPHHRGPAILDRKA